MPEDIDAAVKASASNFGSKDKPRRLIDTKTVKLVDFHDATDIDAIPPYAILSHRWIEGEEVGIQELVQIQELSNGDDEETAKLKKRSGYRKILQACLKARNDKIDYVWVDTCCINKSDHGEVARNIKSMYAYYENAQVCYVYLSDVYRPKHLIQTLGTELAEIGRYCRWRRHFWGVKGRFEDSEWFQRGWTLQELLAPTNVVFFDRDWNRIGNKTQPELSPIISSITGIPRSVLDGNVPVREVDAWSRMSWAIGRKTTRPQDQAYCLFGILSVTMDLDYEEDVKTAFSRLQKSMVKAHPDKYEGSSLADRGDELYVMLFYHNILSRLGWPTREELKMPENDLARFSPLSPSFQRCDQ
ncbi:HET-domain-containing protein [Dendrothele bispora CBS 962.96]|uniref:HET-domain-containing protein n=1 Tax=Dendrothele bispora (strain CBS 962.96) TaxID=1314807 RepID=A0A4S8MH85_DENBC|nr:HET-domain-containing protein [Dendrothele bispora CBS 962.96]